MRKSRKKNITAALIIAILLIGSIVRFYGLTSKDIWLDESTTAYYAKQPIRNSFDGVEKNPPFYFIIIKGFSEIFGIGPFSLRFPSLVFGVLSIFMIYLLGKELFNKNAGLIASLIFALSAFQINYSQEARAYSLYMLFSLLSTYYFIRYYKHKKHYDLVKYVLSSALLLYSHYYGGLLLISHNIFYLFNSKKIKRWIYSQAAIVIIFIPGLILFFKGILLVNDSFWITKAYLKDFYLIMPIFSGRGINLFLYPALFILGIFAVKKRWKEKYFLCITLLTAVSIPLIVSVFFKPIFLVRYIIFASFAYYLLIALFISRQPKKIMWALIVLLVISSVVSIYFLDARTKKEPWKEIVSIKDRSLPDAVIIDPGYYIAPFEYYNHECFDSYPIFPCAEKTDVYLVWRRSPLVFNLDRFDSFMYIVSREKGNNPEYADFLKDHFKTEYHQTFIVDPNYSIFDVYVFKREI